jgi:hypothetical protein
MYSVQSAHNTSPEYAASQTVISPFETSANMIDDSSSLGPRHDSTIPSYGSGDNVFEADSVGRLSHSPMDNTHSRATSSQWSMNTTSVSNYRETVRGILKRGSRSSSCISEIVSLLGRFSLHQSKTSLCDSTHGRSMQKRLSLAETISHQRVPTRSSATVMQNHSRSGQPISRHGVLEQHIETVRKHNAALLGTCRGCSQSQDCVHRRITQVTLFGIQPSTGLPPVQSVVGKYSHYAETDCYGNNVLFFAARIGAPLFVLLEIIQNTPDLNSLNTDGHNFLFVLDPLGFDCPQSNNGDFAKLLDVLEQRRFNFDHLDHNGRSFLLFLCLRPSFRMSWITLLFQKDQAWQWRIKRFALQRDSSGEYLSGYLAGHSDLSTLHRDVLSIICEPKEKKWKRLNGRTKLHDRVIEHLELYISYYSKHHTNQRDISSVIYSSGWDGNDINNYDSKGYTPLTLFVYEALNKHPPVLENYIIYQIQELVGWGADINARCPNGDTILHLAARKSNFKVIQHVFSYSIQINHQNHAGLRAIDCLPSKVSHLTSSTWRRFIEQEPVLQCLLLLQDHGSRPYFMLS